MVKLKCKKSQNIYLIVSSKLNKPSKRHTLFNYGLFKSKLNVYKNNFNLSNTRIKLGGISTKNYTKRYFYHIKKILH